MKPFVKHPLLFIGAEIILAAVACYVILVLCRFKPIIGYAVGIWAVIYRGLIVNRNYQIFRRGK